MKRAMGAERGSIYIEALVSVAVLSLALLPVFGSFGVSARAHDLMGRRAAALNVARGEIERVQGLLPAAWDALPAEATYAAASQPGYTVTRTVRGRAGLAGLKDVTVAVSWAGGGGRSQTVSLATAVARREQP